ncbi:MAG: hypothetical protein NVSMB22_01330 [Chloroflexota bacterium]
MKGASPDVLVARLELFRPSVKSVLLASPTSGPSLVPLGERVAEAARRMGRPARTIRLVDAATVGERSTGDARRGNADDVVLSAAALLDTEATQSLLRGFDGVSVVVGAGLLDDPATLLAARSAECVVLVARVGKTLRSDVVKARLQVEQAGGCIAGGLQIG